MKLVLVSLISALHKEEKIHQSLSTIEGAIKDNFQIEEIAASELADNELDNYDLTFVFVKTGGTENKFSNIYRKLSDPVFLISTPLHNSLPASLEILSWIRRKGGEGTIIHGGPERIVSQMNEALLREDARQKIAGTKIGVIGDSSDWLIASEVDRKKVKSLWGLEFEDIELSEIYARQEDYTTEEISALVSTVLDNSMEVIEPTEKELFEAIQVYLGLSQLVDQYELSALTLRCFDLVEDQGVTGCLGLSLLNDRGTIAGCEGDIPATCTMLIVNEVTHMVPFMANPIEIDSEKDQAVFAHCTIATSIVEKYSMRSHFETGKSVGLQGTVSSGPVTVVKVGGTALDRYFVAEGYLVDNPRRETACRTQIKVKFSTEIGNYFLNRPIGNHHIIISGHHGQRLDDFLQALSLDDVDFPEGDLSSSQQEYFWSNGSLQRARDKFFLS